MEKKTRFIVMAALAGLLLVIMLAVWLWPTPGDPEADKLLEQAKEIAADPAMNPPPVERPATLPPSGGRVAGPP